MQEFHGYPVKLTPYELAGRSFELLGPANSNELIDQPAIIERFETEEYMPYWAQIWSSSLLLADAVTLWGPAGDDPPQVLEIGCGLGLVSLLLSHLGYRVLASDYDEDALAFLVENARRNHVPVPETRPLDWRCTYPDLKPDRIVAADILYETRQLRAVADFVHEHLAPGGLALIADPNRMVADDFETVARHSGFEVRTMAMEQSNPSADTPIRGRIFQLSFKLDA